MKKSVLKLFTSCFLLITLLSLCLLRFTYLKSADKVSKAVVPSFYTVDTSDDRILYPSESVEVSSVISEAGVEDSTILENLAEDSLYQSSAAEIHAVSVNEGIGTSSIKHPAVSSPVPQSSVSTASPVTVPPPTGNTAVRIPAPTPSPSPKPYIHFSPVAVPDANKPGFDDLTYNTDNGSIQYADLSWWSGDWYGFWIQFNCSGDYYSMENNWLDCCASITLDDLGTGSVTIWDEQTNYASPLASANVHVNLDISNQGILSSQEGLFNNEPIPDSVEWTADPSKSPYSNMLPIAGSYSDDKGAYEYLFVLRPWGTVWSDIKDCDLQDYSTYHYNDWYLPLIENGITSAPTEYVGQ